MKRVITPSAPPPDRGAPASYCATSPACLPRNGRKPAGPPTATRSGTNQRSDTAVKARSPAVIRHMRDLPPAGQSATASIGSTASASCGRHPTAADAAAPRATAGRTEALSRRRGAAASARERKSKAGGSDRARGP